MSEIIFQKKISDYFLILLCFFLISCSPLEQAQFQTAVAPAVSTAASEAGKQVQTQVAQMGKTAVASAGTQAVDLQKTAIVTINTQVSDFLTPQPPRISFKISPRDIILYNVIEDISLTEVAFKFSIPVEQIISLNKKEYPAITDEQSRLSVGWRLLLYLGSPDHLDLIPRNDDAWDTLSGCNDSEIPTISIITCNQDRLDFVSKVGMNFGCFSIDGNPLGYYSTHSSYIGKILYYSGTPFIYGVYYDDEKKVAVRGPAIVTSKLPGLPECGIPGNP